MTIQALRQANAHRRAIKTLYNAALHMWFFSQWCKSESFGKHLCLQVLIFFLIPEKRNMHTVTYLSLLITITCTNTNSNILQIHSCMAHNNLLNSHIWNTIHTANFRTLKFTYRFQASENSNSICNMIKQQCLWLTGTYRTVMAIRMHHQCKQIPNSKTLWNTSKTDESLF